MATDFTNPLSLPIGFTRRYRSVDEDSFEIIASYNPKEHYITFEFDDGRIECYATDGLSHVSRDEVDLVLAMDGYDFIYELKSLEGGIKIEPTAGYEEVCSTKIDIVIDTFRAEEMSKIIHREIVDAIINFCDQELEKQDEAIIYSNLKEITPRPEGVNISELQQEVPTIGDKKCQKQNRKLNT